MPRGPKVSPQERAQWLETYNSGMTIAEIAKAAGRDPGTVSKGIRRAQDEKTRAIARQEMYRTTLEEHNRAMVAALGRHKEQMSFWPAHKIASSYSHPGQGGTSSVDFPFEENEKRFIRRNNWHVEGVHGLENELVQEHLKNRIPMWNSYRKWLDQHAGYLWHVWRLSIQAVRQFQSLTGLEPTTRDADYLPECSIGLAEAVLELAGSRRSEIVNSLEIKDYGLDSNRGLFVRSDSAEVLNKAKEVFKSTVTELAVGHDAEAIVGIVPQLERDLPKIRRQFELIQVMSVVEGSCEACKSYVK